LPAVLFRSSVLLLQIRREKTTVVQTNIRIFEEIEGRRVGGQSQKNAFGGQLTERKFFADGYCASDFAQTR
jgi:hypothetical protein